LFKTRAKSVQKDYLEIIGAIIDAFLG